MWNGFDPVFPNQLEIVESDSCFPVGDGNTSPFAPVTSAVLSMTSRSALVEPGSTGGLVVGVGVMR